MDCLAEIPLFNPDSFRLPFQLKPLIGDERVFIIMDTETSHITPDMGSLIQLSMLKATYSPSAKRIVSVIDSFIAYDDPGEPLDEFITELTGITKSNLKNQHISESTIKCFLADSDFFVSHWANFERAFFEKRFPNERHHHWACTLKDIDWSDIEPNKRALTELSERFGWPYGFIAPYSECLALAWLLHSKPSLFEPLFL